MTDLIITPPRPSLGIDYCTFSDHPECLPVIIKMVEKDLSEPYSVFTYRYFVLGWPTLTILAMENEKILGVIVCKVDRSNRLKRLRGYIAMLAEDQNERKRGIGSQLAYMAILKMKNEFHCDEVVLETELSNTSALSLYEKLGFIRDKRLCRYYLNGGDAFRLKLWFTSPFDSMTSKSGDESETVAPNPEIKVESTPSVKIDTPKEVDGNVAKSKKKKKK
jgi:peptide alpha-N-acetyltransferase